MHLHSKLVFENVDLSVVWLGVISHAKGSLKPKAEHADLECILIKYLMPPVCTCSGLDWFTFSLTPS